MHNICPVCKASEETQVHILYGCSFSQKCWELSKVSVQMIYTSALELLLGVFRLVDLKEIRMVCMIS